MNRVEDRILGAKAGELAGLDDTDEIDGDERAGPVRNDDRDARHYHLRSDGSGSICDPVEAHHAETSRVLLDLGLNLEELALESSFVLVEGPSDASALKVLATKRGKSIRARVLPLGGGESGNARSHSRLLQQLRPGSLNCIVVLDRDERSDAELKGLAARPYIRVLERRELENYFLESDAVLTVLREKAASAPDSQRKLSGVSADEIGARLLSVAESLKPLVAVKSGLAALRWPDRREHLDGLLRAGSLETSDLTKLLSKSYSDEGTQALDVWSSTGLPVALASLEDRWQQLGALACAPGADILTGLFKQFGLTYDKASDLSRLVAAANLDRLAGDLLVLVDELVRL